MISEETGESIKYDVIVVGTGLKECILSGLLSVSGKKVLHMDKNGFYGSESASFNLTQAHEHLETPYKQDRESEEYKAAVGRSKDYNLDLCPKLMMAGGDLTKILLKTRVTRYLDFKTVGGSYVYWKNNEGDGSIKKVPTTAKTAWNSEMMGMNAKKNFVSFLKYVNQLDVNNKKTWKAAGLLTSWGAPTFDLPTVTTMEVFKYYSLSQSTISFLGHAVCLYPTNEYLETGLFIDVVKRMQLYLESLLLYQDSRSPYLYPMWGLGGLPEGFSRLAAVHGGVYMLNRPVQELLFDENGKVKGVTAENGETALCDILIAEPTYFLQNESTRGKVQGSGYVARSLMIMNNPPSGVDVSAGSAQIIFPNHLLGDHDCDIYLTVLGKDVECAPEQRYVCCASTKIATNDMEAAKQMFDVVKRAITKNGERIVEEFVTVRETFIGVNQKDGDNCFICSSPDYTTHFQNATTEVKNIYHAITGAPIDLTNLPTAGDDE